MTNLFWKGVVLASCLSCASLVVAANNLSHALTSTVSVSGQMTTNKFQQLIQQGFKSVIVNRPDQEQGNQVKVGQLRSIAEKSQVSVIYQPVNSGQISQANIEEFARYYNELPKPILMVCRSGTRSATLFNQAKSQGLIHE
ncbi:MAG: hypothetical protein ACD_6C00437G0006 [uncultured bacterium]|jgi:sulfide:quinone oxidoreductase|uniref:beta-lactamase hydrolase domain-containing protein n=1 Tax=Acinetobacter sp. TaxID=472 RepID=UPI000284F9FC|nr:MULTISPECIES: sulfur transferase domain-containing protein [Acinetobacter]EKE23525.1 MAG: hypothetical protein ACD_6C00437G0006 [uncultured bacterium]HCB30382.1 hypothetical protein [Acinetobacter lwoffii]